MFHDFFYRPIISPAIICKDDGVGRRVARFFQGHKTTELYTKNHQKTMAHSCQKTTKKLYFLKKKHQFIIFWVVAVPTGPLSQDINNNSKELT